MAGLKGPILVLTAAVLFSTGGAGLKVEAFTASQMSAFRSGIAAVVLLAWMRGHLTWSPSIAGAAALYAATVTLFVSATKLTTAASAIFLQSTAPLYIALLGPALLGERFRKGDLVSLTAVGAGLALLFAGRPAPTGTAPDPATGNLLAFVCSLTWALTLLALRYVGRSRSRGHPGLSAVVAGNALACVVALPYAWPPPAAAPGEWAVVVYLGVVQIGAAYICLTAAVRYLPALEVSLLLLLEPVLNPMWTWLIHGEHPGRAVLVGGGLILAATAARAFREPAENGVTGSPSARP
jgi:drug/metabolite transporter (DMT)-like permease